MECNKKDRRIRVAGIVNDSITDGPGFRFALFVQGCSHHCEGCHNKQTWPHEGASLMTVSEIFEKIKANPLLSGVTLSGGEPFEQSGALVELAKLIKQAGLELCAYTGNTFEELTERCDSEEMQLLELCDILVDGRFVLEKRDLELKFRGSSNQRILDVKKSLSEKRAVLTDDPRWTCDFDIRIN